MCVYVCVCVYIYIIISNNNNNNNNNSNNNNNNPNTKGASYCFYQCNKLKAIYIIDNRSNRLHQESKQS